MSGSKIEEQASFYVDKKVCQRSQFYSNDDFHTSLATNGQMLQIIKNLSVDRIIKHLSY